MTVMHHYPLPGIQDLLNGVAYDQRRSHLANSAAPDYDGLYNLSPDHEDHEDHASTRTRNASPGSSRLLTPTESLPCTPAPEPRSLRSTAKARKSYAAPGVMSVICPELRWKDDRPGSARKLDRCDTESSRRAIAKELRSPMMEILFPHGLQNSILADENKGGLVTHLSQTSSKPERNNGDLSENQWNEIFGRAMITFANKWRALGIPVADLYEGMCSRETTLEYVQYMMKTRRAEPWAYSRFKDTNDTDLQRAVEAGLVKQQTQEEMESPKSPKKQLRQPAKRARVQKPSHKIRSNL